MTRSCDLDSRGPLRRAATKWGRFLPHQRANVDQVPLSFVNDMEETLAPEKQKGADRVCINQNGLAFLESRGGHAAVSYKL